MVLASRTVVTLIPRGLIHARFRNPLPSIPIAQTTVTKLLQPLPAPKQAKVPNGTPIRQSWYVPRKRALEEVRDSLSHNGRPRMVGLVGGSGAGKTTMACEVAWDEGVRDFFSDGVLWFPVNKDAKDNLRQLMEKLATMVYENIMGYSGNERGDSEDSASYINEQMSEKDGKPGLKCLLIADNVWEAKVVTELQRTGMWLLVTTREERLVKHCGGTAIAIGKMSQEDALSVLSKSSGIPFGARLPDDIAEQLMALCGNVAMDLAFVGRWGSVRSRNDRLAWSDVVNNINTELAAMGTSTSEATTKEIRANQRMAILRAGLRYLGAEHEHVQWLYLALSVMPDGYLFSLPDVAVLLFDRKSNTDDERVAAEIVTTLERWSVVRAWGQRYRMHDAHSKFSRGCLREREDVRRLAVRRRVDHLSSLDFIFNATPEDALGPWSLWMQWLSVMKVQDEDMFVGRVYDEQLSAMSNLDPARHRKALRAVSWLCMFEGDKEGEYSVVQRLLNVEQSIHRVNTLTRLAQLADSLVKVVEAEEWYQKAEDTLIKAVRQYEEGGDYQDALFDELEQVAWIMQSKERWDRAERLLVQLLRFQERKFGEASVPVCSTLSNLAYNVDALGRPKEAVKFLERRLRIEESELGSDSSKVDYTRLGVLLQKVGRIKKAEELLRKQLAISKATYASDSSCVAEGMRFLGTCLLKTGRQQDADEAETLLNSAQAISFVFHGPAPPPNFYGEADAIINKKGKIRCALNVIQSILRPGGTCTSGRCSEKGERCPQLFCGSYLVCLLVVGVAISFAYYA